MTVRGMRLLFLAMVFVPGFLWAAADPVRPDQPSTYTVQKGDTLWGIASRFLHQPWYWRELWEANPDIRNPDLIYPGDVIELVYVEGKPRLRRRSTGNTVKLSPRIRTDDGPIPPVPAAVVEPFLNHPRVVDEDILDNAPHIVGFPDGNLLGGEGMRAYVHGPRLGTVPYDILRLGRTYRDPETRKVLGYVARHIGSASLIRSGDPATVNIDTTNLEVIRGDRLMPQFDMTDEGYYFPGTPDERIFGHILDSYDTLGYIGRYQVVLMDRGRNDGLKVGDVLLVDNRGAIITDTFGPRDERRLEDNEFGGVPQIAVFTPKILLPDERAGAIFVFQVFERLSHGLIMKAVRPIRTGDYVLSP
ncbi:MAG: LysM peptidoglycan-binding domain-containing protein [Pseudomonadota bacterium]